MLKKNKGLLVLSFVGILLPIVFGLLVWDKLPQQIPFHWNAQGVVDGYAGKVTAVFAMPCFLAVLQVLCLIAAFFDERNKNQSEKIYKLVFFICPVLSLFLNIIIYSTALGKPLNVITWMVVFFGILFVVIGNYMPKCKPNSTIGIKIKWTLENEENWNATHRLAGKIWVVGGILQTVFCLFVPEKTVFVVFIAGTLLLVLIPTVYSYKFYKKQKQNEE